MIQNRFHLLWPSMDAVRESIWAAEREILDTLLYASFWALLYGSLCFVARLLPAPRGKATRSEWCNQVQSLFHCFAALVSRRMRRKGRGGKGIICAYVDAGEASVACTT